MTSPSENLPAQGQRHENPFALALTETRNQTYAIQRLLEEVLVEGTHYGKIPGTAKDTLYKPGAEKIAVMFHLSPSFQREQQWDGEHLTVSSECTLTHQPTGQVIATGGGMCTTRETKYAYRQATRRCPECGKDTIIRGKKEYGGGWLCFQKKGGCGAKWPDGAAEIESQAEGREPNPNLADTYNTVMKMADKRAFVAATLFGTAASDIFTQDLEDFVDVEPPPRTGPPPITPAQHSRIAIVMKEREMPVDALRDMLTDFGVESRKELTQAQAEELIGRMENWQPESEAAGDGDTPAEQPEAPPPSSGPEPAPDAEEPTGWRATGAPEPRKMRGEDAHDGLTRFRRGLKDALNAGVEGVWWQETGEKARLAEKDQHVAKKMDELLLWAFGPEWKANA